MADKKKTEGEKTRFEEFELNAEDVVGKAKQLFKEGTVRRIMILNEKGDTLLEVPLAVGVAGAAAGVFMAPVLAALGAIAALATRLTIRIERADKGKDDDKDK